MRVLGLGLSSMICLWTIEAIYAVFGRSSATFLGPGALLGTFLALASALLSFGLIGIVFRNRQDLKIWAAAAAAVASCIWATITWMSLWSETMASC